MQLFSTSVILVLSATEMCLAFRTSPDTRARSWSEVGPTMKKNGNLLEGNKQEMIKALMNPKHVKRQQ